MFFPHAFSRFFLIATLARPKIEEVTEEEANKIKVWHGEGPKISKPFGQPFIQRFILKSLNDLLSHFYFNVAF